MLEYDSTLYDMLSNVSFIDKSKNKMLGWLDMFARLLKSIKRELQFAGSIL